MSKHIGFEQLDGSACMAASIASLGEGMGRGEVWEIQLQILREGIRTDPEKQGQLPLAHHVEAPKMVHFHEGEEKPDWEYPEWCNKSVTDHIKVKISRHGRLEAGQHSLKVWMVDPGIVFQKFVVDAGGLKESYPGPPESPSLGKD